MPLWELRTLIVQREETIEREDHARGLIWTDKHAYFRTFEHRGWCWWTWHAR